MFRPIHSQVASRLLLFLLVVLWLGCFPAAAPSAELYVLCEPTSGEVSGESEVHAGVSVISIAVPNDASLGSRCGG